MRILKFEDEVPQGYTSRLEVFETEFLYPLGDSQWFSISHGQDYLNFFRAMGQCVLLVAEVGGNPVGSLVLVRRTLAEYAEGNYQGHPTYYICDLKIAKCARWTRIPAMLMQAGHEVVRSEGGRSAYGIVMGGTERSPASYTGRLGIPNFRCAGEILILRISAGPTNPEESETEYETVSGQDELSKRLHHRISSNSDGYRVFRPETGNVILRSEMKPGIVTVQHNRGFGVLEDTRRGKTLHLMGQSEMISSHLSALSWTEPQWGAKVIRRAVQESGRMQYPAMFCAVPTTVWPLLQPHLRGLEVQISPAAIFACGLSDDRLWWVNTSEI